VLRERRAVCERIADQLAQERERNRVSIRPVTGSIVIQRDVGPIDAVALANRIEEILRGERDDRGEPLRAATKYEGPTRLARALVDTVRALNEDIGKALNGEADLGTLGPFALLLSGAVHVAVSGNLPAPPWSSLFWYSLRSFLSFNQDAVKASGASSNAATQSGGQAGATQDLFSRG
jgi:hypothetical protein